MEFVEEFVSTAFSGRLVSSFGVHFSAQRETSSFTFSMTLINAMKVNTDEDQH